VSDEQAIESSQRNTRMKVFEAGASGAIGQPLIKRLIRDGHEVAGMVREMLPVWWTRTLS
jgi:nucleoside-diphosphate-sugar epimerase